MHYLPPMIAVTLLIHIARFEPFIEFDQCILNVNTFPPQFEHDPKGRKVRVRPSTVDGVLVPGRREIGGIKCTLVFNNYFRRFVVGTPDEIQKRILESQP